MKTINKSLSIYGFCVEESQCFVIDTIKAVRQKFVDSHDLYIGSNGRVYTPVTLCITDHIYWMDCITGSLFLSNGWHMSLNRLDVDNLVMDNELGAEILMSGTTCVQRSRDVVENKRKSKTTKFAVCQ